MTHALKNVLKTFYKCWIQHIYINLFFFFTSPPWHSSLLCMFCAYSNTWVLLTQNKTYFTYFKTEFGPNSPGTLLALSPWSSLNGWQQFEGWIGKYLHADKECLLYLLTTTYNLPTTIWKGSGKGQSKNSYQLRLLNLPSVSELLMSLWLQRKLPPRYHSCTAYLWPSAIGGRIWRNA